MSLHRPVWGEGVSTQEDAFAYPYELVHGTVRQVASTEERGSTAGGAGGRESQGGRPVRILDLGCGVGGGVFYLLDRWDGPLQAIGVTLSPSQVGRARQEARRRGFAPMQYAFLEADFHDLSLDESVDVAFAIESFVLSREPKSFFEEAALILRPGGCLVLIDDFFAAPPRERHLSPREQRWVETMQRGWHAHGLCSVSTAVQEAEAHSLQLERNADLTPFLTFGRPRDQFIKWCIVPLRSFFWEWPYFRGLIGGDALQKCLQEEILEYRHLVFRFEP